MKYQVIHDTFQYVMYLPLKVCSCKMRDILEIPCVHAYAIFTMKHLSIYRGRSCFYLNNTLSSIYRGLINPLANHQQWQIPDDVMLIGILPPNIKYEVGWPKKIRISSMKFKRRVKCGHCRRVGYNWKRCMLSLLN